MQTRLRSSVAVAVVWAGRCSCDSTPSLRTSICPKKKERKEKKKKNNFLHLPDKGKKRESPREVRTFSSIRKEEVSLIETRVLEGKVRVP